MKALGTIINAVSIVITVAFLVSFSVGFGFMAAFRLIQYIF